MAVAAGTQTHRDFGCPLVEVIKKSDVRVKAAIKQTILRWFSRGQRGPSQGGFQGAICEAFSKRAGPNGKAAAQGAIQGLEELIYGGRDSGINKLAEPAAHRLAGQLGSRAGALPGGRGWGRVCGP